MFVSDWMTREVITVTENDSIEDLYNIMLKNRINHLPVVEEDRLIGIITKSDIRQALTSLQFDKTKSKVKDFMVREVTTVNEYDTLEDALVIIFQKKVGSLPVVQSNNKLVGIITRHDIMNAFIKVIGLDKKGVTIYIKIDDTMPEIERLVHTIKQCDRKILSFFTLEKENMERIIAIRFDCVNKIYLEEFFKENNFQIYRPWQ
jgi:acetoin utilization protein AcuB